MTVGLYLFIYLLIILFFKINSTNFAKEIVLNKY